MDYFHRGHATRVCLVRLRETLEDWVRAAYPGITAGDGQIRDEGVTGLLDTRARVSWQIRTTVISCLSISVID